MKIHFYRVALFMLLSTAYSIGQQEESLLKIEQFKDDNSKIEEEKRLENIKRVTIGLFVSGLIATVLAHRSYSAIITQVTPSLRPYIIGEWIRFNAIRSSKSPYYYAAASAFFYMVSGFFYAKPQLVDKAYLKIKNSYKQYSESLKDNYTVITHQPA